MERNMISSWLKTRLNHLKIKYKNIYLYEIIYNSDIQSMLDKSKSFLNALIYCFRSSLIDLYFIFITITNQ